MTPIGVTVLGGYLGAGKTTLLNDLLTRGFPGQHVAVVVNDFGVVNVDAALVRSRSEDMLELANGCVCCSVRDGMIEVMERLRALRPAPARVLLEVSGVGDPAAVAAWADHPGFTRRGVVVCADAVAVRALAGDRWVADTVVHQLRGADVVLLTKLDLVETDEAGEVRRWVKSLVGQGLVLDDRDDLARLLRDGPPRRLPSSLGPEGAQDRHVATHAAWSVPLEAAPSRAALERALAALPDQVVRVKGVLTLADSPGRRTVVHVVAGRATVDDAGPWRDDPEPTGLVVVTRGSPTDTDRPSRDAEIVRLLQRDLTG